MISLLHATCIEWEGLGVLITGASGSGKSTLALELIERGARLVADDQVQLVLEDGYLSACALSVTAGIMELAGFGVIRLPESQYCPKTTLFYEFHLTHEPLERIVAEENVVYLAKALRRLQIPAHDPTIGNKAIHYLRAVRDGQVIERLPVASSAKSA